MARLLRRSLPAARSSALACLKFPRTFPLQPSALGRGCPFPSCTPYSCQRGRGALGSLGDSLGLSTFYWRQRDPGVGKRENGLEKSVLVPTQDRPGESFLALHQESSRFSQHSAPLCSAAFLLFPRERKRRREKKKRKTKEKMAKLGLLSLPALGARQPQRHRSK